MNQMIKIQGTNNLCFLERYFERQGIFRFHNGVSHILLKNGTIADYNMMINKNTIIHVNFFITIYDKLQSIMYFDIVELYLAENMFEELK